MSLRILIIDENRALCNTITALLQGKGCQVVCAHAGREGIAAAESMQPDLIILDLATPDMTGLEMLRRLERLKGASHVPVIVVSAQPELEDEILNVFDFMVKPLDMQRLCANIELVREGRRKGRPVRGEELGSADCRLFYEFLLTHSGLHFEQRNMKLLERGLLNRMSALKICSFREYYDYLILYQESRQEFNKLLQFLTVGETYFFRYNSHFKALKHHIIPELIDRRRSEGGKAIRIWSAGCSTGEEPYSIAMVLLDSIPDWRDWDIRVLATDINSRAVRRAKDAVYGPRALRVTEPEQVERYFHKIGNSYIVKDEVRRLVDFSYLNLQKGPFPEGLDAVFCRNVMIYFNLPTTREIVRRFTESLNPGGYFFLGHSETLMQISSSFERISRFGGFYYRKDGVSLLPRPSEEERRSERKPGGSVFGRSLSLVVPPAPPGEAASEAGGKPSPLPADATLPVVDTADALYAAALALFDAEDYAGASELLRDVLRRRPEHEGALVMRGFILANKGLFEEALKACEEVLAINDLLADAYFLKGLVLDMSDRSIEAMAEYQKTILLKMDFVMPHYHFGKLCFRQGKDRAGVRELKNCLRILEKEEEGTIIPYSGGLSREVFMGLIHRELGAASVFEERAH